MIFNGVAAGPVRESPVSRKNRLRQVVVLATRRSRREREQLRDDDIVARRAQFARIGGNYAQLVPLGDVGAPIYDVPESGPAKLEYRGRSCDSRPAGSIVEPAAPPHRLAGVRRS